jgi:bud emergence protein 1
VPFSKSLVKLPRRTSILCFTKVPKSLIGNFSGPRASQASSHKSSPSSPSILPPSLHPKSQVFYAVVLHDFSAERADELEAKSGDSITVVAQSNREWFVAKPIGRIGRPGLIPATFVEIRDPSTGKKLADVEALIDRGDIPKVEEWKRQMMTYKQNSIALGVLESPTRESMVSNSMASMASESTMVDGGSSHDKLQEPESKFAVADAVEPLPEGILLVADVVSFHFEMEEFWFRIDAIFQPYKQPGQASLPPAKQLILFRVYDDFYNFQVTLLDHFPKEAGRQPPQPRILPYMPGPADNVDAQLTATRRSELDEYIHSLCDLGRSGYRYILEHSVVREFLALKPGDVENETPARDSELAEIFHGSRPGSSKHHQMQHSLSQLRLHDDDEGGSEYEDEGYAASPQQRAYDRDHHPYQSDRRSNDSQLRLQAISQSHQRSGSATSFRDRSPYPNGSRSNSPLRTQNRSHSPNPPRATDSPHQHYHAPSASTSSFKSMQAPPTTRSRSQSTTNNLNSPPISAANPQTAFVKIKIFDRVADDLIAIRVHPKVTHTELMEKVVARLGGEVSNLRYRDSVTNDLVSLDSDGHLRNWIEGTDKHVLYAD